MQKLAYWRRFVGCENINTHMHMHIYIYVYMYVFIYLGSKNK